MNVLCFSIDGLQNAMLGAYGNGWIQTPTLNALASQSVVFDRFYTTALNLTEIFDFFTGKQFPAVDYFLTDDSAVFLHTFVSSIERKHLFETPKLIAPVHELEETQFFRAIASAVTAALEYFAERQGSMAWVHLAGFRSVWDFPMSYRERHRGDEDPNSYAGVRIPKRENETDPDELQCILEAYSGGVAVLDDSLAGVLDLLEGHQLSETMLIFMGTRGFSLGEHRRIGKNDSLYGENLHLPLMIRFPNAEYAEVRVPQIVQFPDLADFLSYPAASELLQLIKEEKTAEIYDRIFFRNDRGERAVLTPEWFLRRGEDGKLELYAKPDDRFEFNNVADRRPDTAEELNSF